MRFIVSTLEFAPVPADAATVQEMYHPRLFSTKNNQRRYELFQSDRLRPRKIVANERGASWDIAWEEHAAIYPLPPATFEEGVA